MGIDKKHAPLYNSGYITKITKEVTAHAAKT